MAQENELVAVFRSVESDAEEQAGVVRDLLVRASIAAEILDDSAPGVPEGAFEVRVPAAQQAGAEEVLDSHKDFAPNAMNLSHDLDMVAAFVSDAAEAELLATQIRSIFDAQEIPSVMISGSVFPNLPFEIRVPRDRLEEARKAIAAAEEAGPAAAEEAERESESPGSVELP